MPAVEGSEKSLTAIGQEVSKALLPPSNVRSKHGVLRIGNWII
jgi:hypothetical protein